MIIRILRKGNGLSEKDPASERILFLVDSDEDIGEPSAGFLKFIEEHPEIRGASRATLPAFKDEVRRRYASARGRGVPETRPERAPTAL